jgi:hypothetical protein
VATVNKDFRIKNGLVTGAGSANELTYPTSDGTNGQVLTTDGSGQLSFSTRLANVVEDTSPQLGGHLDTLSYRIGTGSAGLTFYQNTSPGGISGQVIYASTDSKLVLSRGDLIFTDSGDAPMTITAPSDWDSPYTLTLPTNAGTNGQVLTTDGSGNLSFADAPGIANVVEDTTPQLGGNLDTNGFEIAPADTSGSASSDIFKIHGKNSTSTFGTDGGGRLRLLGGSGYFGGEVRVQGGTANDPSGTAGDVIINGGERDLTPYTGDVKIQGLTYPSSDGTNGQVLTTDGSGNLSFTTIAGGASSLNELSDVYYDSDLNLGIGSTSYSFTASSGLRNIAIGQNAGDSITTGDDNIVLGPDAGTSLSSGSYNVAIGKNALDSKGYLVGGVAIGAFASKYLPASNTTAVGYTANRNGYEDNLGVYLGSGAGYGSVSYSGHNYNSHIGANAGYNIFGGDHNTMVGNQSGYNVNDASYNTFIGSAAGYGTSTSNNTLVGFASGNSADGTGNTALGRDAGYYLDGNYNVAIGYQALNNASITGNYNIGIGYNVDTSSLSVSNELTFGANAGLSGEITRMRIPGLGFDTNGATAGQVITADGSGGMSFQDAAGGGISSLIEDTSPQLGGSLDVVYGVIYSSNNYTGILGSNSGVGGTVSISGNQYANGNGNVYIQGANGSNGSHNVYLSAGGNNGYSYGDVYIGSDGSVYTNNVYINDLLYPSSDGSNGQVLTTDGSGQLSFQDAGGSETVGQTLMKQALYG